MIRYSDILDTEMNWKHESHKLLNCAHFRMIKYNQWYLWFDHSTHLLRDLNGNYYFFERTERRRLHFRRLTIAPTLLWNFFFHRINFFNFLWFCHLDDLKRAQFFSLHNDIKCLFSQPVLANIELKIQIPSESKIWCPYFIRVVLRFEDI